MGLSSSAEGSCATAGSMSESSALRLLPPGVSILLGQVLHICVYLCEYGQGWKPVTGWSVTKDVWGRRPVTGHGVCRLYGRVILLVQANV